ncbi:hypothetical protein ABT369_52015 [Dactylosporangium sp. NPDC000244]|uniref:hypothetical protein n=1 Tax=Dactylosporangium sp. NPDC000244 TaxID=3154365 RepID=UPI003329047F
MAISLAGCSGPLGGEGVLTAAGWAPDGSIVAATHATDHPAKLWSGAPGEELRPLAFEYCQPAAILSVFRLSGDRLGLTVVCGEQDEAQLEAWRNGQSAQYSVRLVALQPSSGRVEQLAAKPARVDVSIQDGVWSEAAGAGFVEYSNGCPGVGRLDAGGAVQPLALTVPLPGGSVSMSSEPAARSRSCP